jgi:hypothetical protein
MRVPLAHATDLRPERLAATLARLCEREGLDPCETACVIIEGLAWTPRLPRAPKPSPRAVAGLDRSGAQTIDPAESIRRRAYEIWQAEGQPHGRALEHWCRAEAEAARNRGRGLRDSRSPPDDMTSLASDRP